MLDVDADCARTMMQRLDGHELSLDAPAHGEGSRSALAELPDVTLPPDELAIARETARTVRRERERFRAHLSGRRREIFDARWSDDDPPSLQQLAERYGVTRERTRQIESRLLEQLGEQLAHAV
jgi:RNA polymerase sigma-32 factor